MNKVSLIKKDWDEVEDLIEEFLAEHVRAWEDFDYFVIDDSRVLIKVYGPRSRLMFTVKARLSGEKLEVVDVS